MTPTPSSPPTPFDAATAVTARRDGSAYDATVDGSWTIGDKPNGGYLLALMARAARQTVQSSGADHPDPLAASATYLRPPEAGPAVVRTELRRAGRTASQVHVALDQGGAMAVEALITLGTLRPEATPWWSDAPPPELAPEPECVRLVADVPGEQFRAAIMDVIEVRLDPAVTGFTTGSPGGGGELRGWLRFTDGRAADTLSLLFVADAYPPATFELVRAGWVPTLELTVYVRGIPAPGPLRVRQRARLVEGGMVDEICEVWDSRGRAVAQGTQLARIRVPPAAADA